MIFSTILLPLLAARALAGCVFARDEHRENPHTNLRQRTAFLDTPLYPRDENRTLIGDLRYNISTPIGKTIAGILLGTESGQSNTPGTPPTTSDACKADACCIWYNISSDLTNTYQLNAGCGDLARQAIRAGFHDAATWSAVHEAKGDNCCGADGSLLLSGTELNRADNLGLEDMPGLLNPLYTKYKKYGVGMADLIQYAAVHAVVTCTQGPRIRAFVGRKDSKKAAPNHLLPEPYNSANYIISLFQNKTIISDDLISLVGAHSTAKQFFVNTSLAGEPLDETPGVWDYFYYAELLQSPQPQGVYRLQSDVALSADPVTSGRWNTLANGGQPAWNAAYSMAYVRMSLLGVDNLNYLNECTQTLPMAETD
ncbi:MAG: hypothetical protein LQ340_005973 [Diploschistes diacapsis]|nr:MAG: hypothetical protein LQ340_005973 [Diploschistes diacapsis]